MWSQRYPQLGELIQTGKLQEAQAIVDRELALDPGQPELIYWQAVLHLIGNRVEQAYQILNGLEQEGRAMTPHQMLLGQIYESQQDWERAAEIYRKLLAQVNLPKARLGLALSEFKLRNYDAAIEMLQPMATENAPAEVPHLLGLAHLGKGDLPTAAQQLATAVRRAPEDARYHYDFGLVLMQGQKLEAAVQEFQRAAELQPDWPEAFLYQGRALHDLNRGDDARQAFLEAARLNPKLPLLQYHLGLLEKGRGNSDEAIQHFEKEIELGTRYPPCYFHLAELSSRHGEPERSRELAETAVQLAPDNAEYRLLAAKLALNQDDTGAAEAHLQVALALDPESGPTHYLQGRLLQTQGKPEEAAREFAEARRLSDLKSQRTGKP